MEASWNRGTPKSSILVGFSIKNQPFWGTSIYGNPHIYIHIYIHIHIHIITGSSLPRTSKVWRPFLRLGRLKKTRMSSFCKLKRHSAPSSFRFTPKTKRKTDVFLSHRGTPRNIVGGCWGFRHGGSVVVTIGFKISHGPMTWTVWGYAHDLRHLHYLYLYSSDLLQSPCRHVPQPLPQLFLRMLATMRCSKNRGVCVCVCVPCYPHAGNILQVQLEMGFQWTEAAEIRDGVRVNISGRSINNPRYAA